MQMAAIFPPWLGAAAAVKGWNKEGLPPVHSHQLPLPLCPLKVRQLIMPALRQQLHALLQGTERGSAPIFAAPGRHWACIGVLQRIQAIAAAAHQKHSVSLPPALGSFPGKAQTYIKHPLESRATLASTTLATQDLIGSCKSA